MRAPRSPLNLLQEIYQDNPWKIVVCCIMLNQTTGTQVHQIIKKLFRKYPSARKMSKADPIELSEIIRSCGLYNRRANSLIKFSQDYITKDWKEPNELYGVGQYAQDSYDIFVRDKMIRPADKELKKYMQWKRKWLKTVK